MADNIDLLTKLFDTLKDSSDENERTIRKLIEQQTKLVGHIEYLPINEIKDDIKEHVISAAKERKEISNKIDTVASKVGKMILVVVVAFTLFSTALLVAKIVNDEPTHTTIVEQYRKHMEDQHSK